MLYKDLFLTFFIAGIALFLLAFVIDYLYQKRRDGKEFHILKSPVYELNSFKKDDKKSHLIYALYIFAQCLIAAASLMFAIYYSNLFSAVSAYIFFAIAVISMIIFNILRFVKLTNFKGHLIFCVSYVCINLLLVVLYFIYFTNTNYGYCLSDSKRIPMIISTLILVLFECFLMLNSGRKGWAYTIKEDDKGNVVTKKINYLALLEWGNLLVFILSYCVLALVLFLK